MVLQQAEQELGASESGAAADCDNQESMLFGRHGAQDEDAEVDDIVSAAMMEISVESMQGHHSVNAHQQQAQASYTDASEGIPVEVEAFIANQGSVDALGESIAAPDAEESTRMASDLQSPQDEDALTDANMLEVSAWLDCCRGALELYTSRC